MASNFDVNALQQMGNRAHSFFIKTPVQWVKGSGESDMTKLVRKVIASTVAILLSATVIGIPLTLVSVPLLFFVNREWRRLDTGSKAVLGVVTTALSVAFIGIPLTVFSVPLAFLVNQEWHTSARSVPRA